MHLPAFFGLLLHEQILQYFIYAMKPLIHRHGASLVSQINRC
jgi:hypothetical protein